jgi:hypothetical protein
MAGRRPRRQISRVISAAQHNRRLSAIKRQHFDPAVFRKPPELAE